jgi:hypothetical protein
MTTPAWSAPVNGQPGNLNATNTAGQLNQFLGSHAFQELYAGAGINTPVHGNENFQWFTPALNQDVDQPFTLSGTTVGRVQLSIMPSGNGADLLVTLYPDNGSGAPNTSSPLASTKVPAAYQLQVCAPQGLVNAANLPLATGQNNSLALTGGVNSITWAPPASTINGISQTSSMLFDSNYVISFGGQDSVTGVPVPTVYTFYYPGGAALDLPTPQPSLPQGAEGASAVVCNGSIVVLGGSGVTTPVVSQTTVFTAAWDPGTGTIGAWTNQPALPQGKQFAGAASWKNFVYIVGGLTGSSPQNSSATVYVNTVNNGQIVSWVQVNSLPTTLWDLGCFAVNGWLVVVGGDVSVGSGGTNNTYYAAIQSDGSLGPWQKGPSLTNASTGAGNALFDTSQQGQLALAGDVIVAVGPYNFCQFLSVTAEGPAPYWRVSDWIVGNGGIPGYGYYYQGAFSNGDGTYSLLALQPESPSLVVSTTLSPVPMVSVPLYASGLTNSATYHVVVQASQSRSASDYTSIGLAGSTTFGQAYTATALTSSRFSGAWTALSPSGTCVPMQVYDASAAGRPIHVWQDPDPQFEVAQSTASLLYNNVGLLAGVLEVTAHPNNPLNANPTFTSGVSPWTAVNGTIAQSSAQTHGGFAFSGLLTPTGGHATASALSELFPVQQTPYGDLQWVVPTGWFYTPTTWANFSLSVNWYDSSQTLISTSSATVSLTGATWTQVSNHFQPAPTAAYGQIAPTMSGTPGSANTLFMSNVPLTLTPETISALTSAATVNYGTTPFPPIGVTQLN